MYILIMNPEWGEKILSGEKTWEARRSAAKHIERIKIAYSKNRHFTRLLFPALPIRALLCG